MNNKKFYFPLHLDGDNRGCEAIAKGTAILLGEPKERLIGLCTNIPLDEKLGTSKYVSLVQTPIMTKAKLLLRKAHRLIAPQRSRHMAFVYKQRYNAFLDSIPTDGIVMSTGGDMYCYENNEAVYTTTYCQNKGLRTILWGCSIGQVNLTKEKLENLKRFDLIYVRESLTEEVLHKNGIDKIINYPDPAFILDPEIVDLPEYFKNDVIGLNLSNFVLGNDACYEMVKRLIDYILENTNCIVMLLPHVLWGSQSDIITSMRIKENYLGDERIKILDSANYNYCQLRYIISKCRFFIGARTHSVISAYSTCTPCLALGYSIKSRGIAKDLNLSDSLVVDCTNDISEDKLVNAYCYMQANESEIRNHLKSIIPIYKERFSTLLYDLEKYLK